jgi:hypothetical protein
MIGYLLVAENLYHTSGDKEFEQRDDGFNVVASTRVPVDVAPPTVNDVALEQSSFDGGFCTQIVNPFEPDEGFVVTYTLT